MKELASSPDRGTFGTKRFQERLEADPSDQHATDMIEYYKSWEQEAAEREQDPEWQKDNLEYDLRTCETMVAKCREHRYYAQNLYAAMCNREFQRVDVMPILQDKVWSCTWRYAGGIVAHMCGQGDYIDWYCSGIAGGDEPDVYNEGADLKRKNYVPEGVVTDEIQKDLEQLGWRVLDNEEES